MMASGDDHLLCTFGRWPCRPGKEPAHPGHLTQYAELSEVYSEGRRNSCAYLNVLHVLEEVHFRVMAMSELHQILEFQLIGESLNQTGEDPGIIMPNTLQTPRGDKSILNVSVC